MHNHHRRVCIQRENQIQLPSPANVHDALIRHIHGNVIPILAEAGEHGVQMPALRKDRPVAAHAV